MTRRWLIRLGFLVAAAAGVAGGLVSVSMEDMPDIGDLIQRTPTAASKLYDATDPPELIAQISVEQRTFVPLARMPRALQDAIVAIEDERFYSHWGVDLWGIARAVVANTVSRLQGKRRIQGGSTITQQLARTLFLTQERTIQRKIKEAILAISIERAYKKEEILEMYLNQVYFGHGAWGAEQAARSYFGKHVEELTLPECALIAGLPQAPNAYSPRTDPEVSKGRRNVVLGRMIGNGFVERAEGEEAMQAQVQLRQTEVTNAPYFGAHVRKHLEEAYGTQAIYRGGLSVYTTLNLRLQTVAQRALEHGLAAAEGLLKERHGGSAAGSLRLQGALVALDPRTGAILSMVGGRSFRENEFNRATQARRQPGSSFKPVIYATGLLNGHTPADLINDAPEQFPGKDGKMWQPTNFERKNFGPTPLRRALALSRNVVTVKLLNRVGTHTVIALARKFGYAGPFRDDLTLALGTSEVGLLEMVSAFSVFANGGVRAEPHAIRLVKDSQGNILEQHRTVLTPVLGAPVAYQMVSMLEDTINRGTASVIRRLGFTRPAAGKTGSTNDFTDAWFIGFTPTLACGIWIGFDDRRSMGKNMTGGLIAAPVWAAYMSEALEHAAVAEFEKPNGLVTAVIDPRSGLLATKVCPRPYPEVFVDGTAPTRNCTLEAQGGDFIDEEYSRMEQLQTPTLQPADGRAAPGTPGVDDRQSQEGGF